MRLGSVIVIFKQSSSPSSTDTLVRDDNHHMLTSLKSQGLFLSGILASFAVVIWVVAFFPTNHYLSLNCILLCSLLAMTALLLYFQTIHQLKDKVVKEAKGL